jgi:hypothetical protein
VAAAAALENIAVNVVPGGTVAGKAPHLFVVTVFCPTNLRFVFWAVPIRHARTR